MEYLTWRQLRERTRNLSDLLLDEPVLFAHLDAYGSETLLPVQLIRDTWNPVDTPNTLRYDEENEEYSRSADASDESLVLRQFPFMAPLLSFSEMDEDHEERNAWLATPNPHTLPAVPGPAPLFEPHHIPCGQCGACLAHEPCARLL